MKKYLKNILYGFLAWLIPFVASFFFYTREGELTIFKKINADYFTRIGIRYPAIPAMSIAVGTALENKK